MKQLPASNNTPYGHDTPAPDSALAKGFQPAGSSDEVIQWLQQRVAFLERELAGAEDRYRQLDGIYTKLADQWNAFQATAKPDNRNVHRAEEAGELARKLAEVFIGLAYDKDVSDALRVVFSAMMPKIKYTNLAKDSLELPEHGPDRR